MTGYIARRILVAIPTLVATSIVVFLMVRLMPGDVIDFITGGSQTLTPEQRHQMEHQLGLDQSYVQQYWEWIRGLLTGDMGKSLVSTLPVGPTLRDAMPITFELVGLALTIALVIAIPLGVLSAVRRDSVHDYTSRIGALVGISVPNFWLATLLLIFTSRVLHWVPPLTYVSPTKDLAKNLSQFILPAISISVFTLAIVTRMVRATMLEVLNLDYVRTARAKGLAPRRIIYRHALRNALIPVVTIVGFQVAILIGGTAIVETIFTLPGIGYTLLQAIKFRDYPIIQDATMLIAVVVIFMNLVVDILYGLIDRRISLTNR
jgi:peptide/nickel transport system permease protein